MISTRGRYAIRVMIDLVEHDTGKYIPLKDIAARQEISKKYLEIIVKDMVAGGLLVGASGKGGGYKLCRKPEEYSVGEIIELMEGSLASVACLAEGTVSCPRASECPTLPLWEEYNRLTRDFFYGKRITDLTSKQDADVPQEQAAAAGTDGEDEADEGDGSVRTENMGEDQGSIPE